MLMLLTESLFIHVKLQKIQRLERLAHADTQTWTDVKPRQQARACAERRRHAKTLTGTWKLTDDTQARRTAGGEGRLRGRRVFISFLRTSSISRK